MLPRLCHGCPPQAIVAAVGDDERPVAAWLARAGSPCQQVHAHLVQQGKRDLQHVQADELWAKLVGQRVGMALALAVPSRLWLGGVISPQRDRARITALVQQVRAGAQRRDLLVCDALPQTGAGELGSCASRSARHSPELNKIPLSRWPGLRCTSGQGSIAWPLSGRLLRPTGESEMRPRPPA